MKISGFVDGEPAGLRQCAEFSWVALVGGEDNCVNSSSIHNFFYAIGGKTVELVDGVVCLCDENECNGTEKNVPIGFACISAIVLSIVRSIVY